MQTHAIYGKLAVKPADSSLLTVAVAHNRHILAPRRRLENPAYPELRKKENIMKSVQGDLICRRRDFSGDASFA